MKMGLDKIVAYLVNLSGKKEILLMIHCLFL